MGGQRGSALKSSLVVVEGLDVALMTLEMAFKPFLDSIQSAMAKLYPGHNPHWDAEEAGQLTKNISDTIAFLNRIKSPLTWRS